MKLIKLFLPTLTIIIVGITYIFSRETTLIAISTIETIVNTLMPILLPFMLFTALLIAFGGDIIIGYFLQFITVPLFKISGESSILIFLGSLTGFPFTAIYGSEVVQKEPDKKQEIQLIVNSIFFPSINFMFIAIATATKQHHLSLLLVIAIFISGFFKLFFCSSFQIKEKKQFMTIKDVKKKLNEKYINIKVASSIKSCIYETFISFLNIAGVILIFSTVAQLSVKWINPNFHSIVLSLFEVTTGTLKLSQSLSTINLLLISFFIGISGLSVLFQAYTFLESSILSFKSFFYNRISQSILNVIVLFILLKLFT